MAGKRGNNEGSITQLGDGRWQARITIDGKRKPFYGRTRQEAARKLTTALRDRDRGLPVALNERQTVGQFLQHWLENTAKPTTRPSTYHGYEVLVRVHITPELGKVALAKLTPQQVQNLLATKVEQGLSPRTVQYMRAVLRRALGQALKWGLVGRNVAALVDPPAVPKHEIHPLTAAEVRQFLTAVTGDRLEALYYVAFGLGLRQGEVLGLRWQDIDLDATTLRVAVALQRVQGEYRFVEPKSKKSRRVLPLPVAVLAALRSHKVRQLEERLYAGPAWEGDGWGLVFTTVAGAPLSGSWITHVFQRHLERAKLPKVRFHDARHSAASMLLAQGVPMREIMEILGHSTIVLTADTYTHIAAAMHHEAARLMDVALQG